MAIMVVKHFVRGSEIDGITAVARAHYLPTRRGSMRKMIAARMRPRSSFGDCLGENVPPGEMDFEAKTKTADSTNRIGRSLGISL